MGAYQIAPEGVTVTYDLTFTPKRWRWFKGDLHAHTVTSDGVLTLPELAQHARRHGLDYLAITDHNQMVTAAELPRLPGLTLIPGLEWTHYQGHANFLGLEKPYDEPFYTNTVAEMQSRFETAHARGAVITINHPFEACCVFRFEMDTLPFDCLEIWNGPMRESNLKALALWQSLLVAGRKIVACGGSDYHRDQPFQFLGGPTTCLYAASPSPADLLSALKQGHAYITFAPGGPTLEMTAGEAILGDSVPFVQQREIQISAGNLQAGDILQVITPDETRPGLPALKFCAISCPACRLCRR